MSPSHRIRRFLGAHRAFCVHAALALVIVLVALLAGVIAPMSPYEANLAEAFQGPSAQHWFGTDKLGRDMASRVIYGTRVSLAASIVLVLVISVVGSLLGVIAGYAGGLVDAVIMRVSDMMISFPGIVLAIAVAGLMGASIRNAIIALAVVRVRHWCSFPGPGAQDAHTTMTVAPPSARSMKWVGNLTS